MTYQVHSVPKLALGASKRLSEVFHKPTPKPQQAGWMKGLDLIVVQWPKL